MEISDVEAAPGRRRRLLQDVVHIAVEVSCRRNANRCCAIQATPIHESWQHRTDHSFTMQIITDNPKQAAAVAERLSEENVNNELEALGLPKGKVIQGLSLSA